MKKIKRIIGTSVGILAAGAAIFAAIGVMGLTAWAASTPPHDQVLRVDATGKALLRGTITVISGSTFTVKGWGGDWTVHTSAATEALPKITGNDLANFQVGDYVGVQGTASEDAAYTVDATLVRDWTYRDAIAVEQKQNRDSAAQAVKIGTARNYVGFVSGANGGMFALMPTGATGTLSVDVASDAEVVNRNWIALPATSIADGDVVRVWGISTNGTIAAKIVRDISVPATSTVPVVAP